MNYLTALNQLTNSDNGIFILKIFIGAYDFLYFDKTRSVQFKFTAKGNSKANFCRIVYDVAKDLYNLEFALIKNDEETNKKTFSGLYFDQLKDVFENYTGLYLSFC